MRRAVAFACRGSSPHVRGALLVCHDGSFQYGIIPACAGSTTVPCRPRLRAGDHPRMCGEHDPPIRVGARRKGSSPHVRGALTVVFDNDGDVGIIPACAGSTGRNGVNPIRLRDHPRMCGEHMERAGESPFDVGSSPHVRGARVICCIRFAITGIIPACAGSTYRNSHPSRQYRDHPRMCGEHCGSATRQ